jgi:hypothetical protein
VYSKSAHSARPGSPERSTLICATSARVLHQLSDPGPGPTLPAMYPTAPITKNIRNRLQSRPLRGLHENLYHTTPGSVPGPGFPKTRAYTPVVKFAQPTSAHTRRIAALRDLQRNQVYLRGGGSAPSKGMCNRVQSIVDRAQTAGPVLAVTKNCNINQLPL